MLSFLSPHLFLNGVLELEPGFLQSRGIRGLLLDLDGTLKDFGAEKVPAQVAAWILAMRASGLQLCLLSNGKSRRIGRIAETLDLPFVAKAFKPMPWGCRKALKILGLKSSQVAVVGDQVFADVLAGRLAGLFTVLVTPTHIEEPWFTRIKRPMERRVLSWLRLAPPAKAAAIAPSYGDCL